MALLTQFLFRLSFGLALAMAITSPRWVNSGYYRVHSYVLLGLHALAALVAWSHPEQFALWPPLLAAGLSYAGAVAWLYEKAGPGILLLGLVAVVSLIGSWLAAPVSSATPLLARWLHWSDPATGGLLLGSTMAAMLLGHWYLNNPGMRLEPLRRLVLLMAWAVALRAVQCAAGVVLEIGVSGMFSFDEVLFLSLRWLAGLLGMVLLIFMTWKTLDIPNTQSATGILYVGVIGTFVGELTSQLLSAETVYPL